MKVRARNLVAIGCLVALLGGACSQGDVPRSEGAPVASREADKARASGKGTGSTETSTGAAAGNAPKAAAGSKAGASKEPGAIGSDGGAGADSLALGSSEAVDSPSDREGMGPGYGEIVRASVVGGGDVVTFSVQVAEALPKRLRKESNLIVGIGLQEGPGQGAVAVIAQATATGWTAVVQSDEGSRPVKDWSVTSDTITWTVPWSWVGGPRAFEWGASLKLFDFSTEAGAASDMAPNSGPEAFPHD